MRDRTARFAVARESPVPIARILIFPPTQDNSTTSSLTARTPAVNEEDSSNRKRPAESQPGESPSPAKNPLPNFDMRPSDDDSILSGDDSDGWEVEEDKVVSFFADQMRKEDALDNTALVDCPPVACVAGTALICWRCRSTIPSRYIC